MIEHFGNVVITKEEPGDRVFYSVTSIIGGSVPTGDGLVWSARKETARLAIARRSSLTEAPEDEVVDALARAQDRQWKIKRDTGSAVHDALEAWVLDGRRPAPEAIHGTDLVDPDVRDRMLDQFDRWAAEALPDYEAAELTVYNPARGYAGTADAIAVIGGVRFLIDYKTTAEAWDSQGRPRTPYPDSNALQLSAYQHAEFAALFRARRVEAPFSPRYYALNNTEVGQSVPMPEVDMGLIVLITPESCAAYPVALDDRPWHAFLHCIETYRWVKHTSGAVMGPPLDFRQAVAS